MDGIIEKIAVLMGLGRTVRIVKKRTGKLARVLRESDTISISLEARRLADCGAGEGPLPEAINK